MERKIEQLMNRYNPESDVISAGNYPNFNYIDAELLDLIERLNKKVNELEREVKRLSPTPA